MLEEFDLRWTGLRSAPVGPSASAGLHIDSSLQVTEDAVIVRSDETIQGLAIADRNQ